MADGDRAEAVELVEPVSFVKRQAGWRVYLHNRGATLHLDMCVFFQHPKDGTGFSVVLWHPINLIVCAI